MKRNHPPFDDARDRAEEKHIIEKRLKDLYATSPCRKVIHTIKGFWSPEERHVKLNDNVNAQQFDGMVTIDSVSGCNHMNPYQALYLMESGHLLIYYNELPISITESYHLLLHTREDLINYLVFSQLNRDGYFCFASEFASLIQEGEELEDEVRIESASEHENLEPLLKLDSIQMPYHQVLERLQLAGPKLELGEHFRSSNSRYNFTFDIYKRESYSKNRARKGRKIGLPDHHVIVCDKSKPMFDKSPSGYELMQLNKKDTDNVKFSGNILFALVDPDSSLSFVHFDQFGHKTDIDLSGSKIMPYKYEQGISPDYKDVF